MQMRHVPSHGRYTYIIIRYQLVVIVVYILSVLQFIKVHDTIHIILYDSSRGRRGSYY